MHRCAKCGYYEPAEAILYWTAIFLLFMSLLMDYSHPGTYRVVIAAALVLFSVGSLWRVLKLKRGQPHGEGSVPKVPSQ